VRAGPDEPLVVEQLGDGGVEVVARLEQADLL